MSNLLIKMNSTKMLTTLERLGFTEGDIVESILITRDEKGGFNPAPMGVIRDLNLLEVRIFKSSNSFKNLINDGKASINLTDDPLLFHKAAFKEDLGETPLITDWILNGSDTTIYAEKHSGKDFSDNRHSFFLNPVSIKITKKEPTVFSRGRAQAIESIIHSTRIKFFHSEDRIQEVKSLLELVDWCFNVINKVSHPDSNALKVVNSLKELFEQWGVDY